MNDLEHGIRYNPNPPDPSGGALIIRDDDGLDTLDPDTLIIDWKGAIHRAATAFRLPCAVLATGDRVRAAEEALKELKHP